MVSHIPTSAPILIATEAPTEGLVLEGILRLGTSHEVRVTSDAREIVPLYDKWPYALLILDVGMSTRSSLEILQDFASKIENRSLAVLVLAAHADEAQVEQMLKAGAVDAIQRPLGKDDVLMHVGWALRTLPRFGRMAETNKFALH